MPSAAGGIASVPREPWSAVCGIGAGAFRIAAGAPGMAAAAPGIGAAESGIDDFSKIMDAGLQRPPGIAEKDAAMGLGAAWRDVAMCQCGHVPMSLTPGR